MTLNTHTKGTKKRVKKKRSNTLKRFKFKNQKKLLITLDWLTLSAEDIFQHWEFPDNGLIEKDWFVYEFVNQPTDKFTKMIKVYTAGVFVATILYDARHNHILRGRCHIKFENTLFYDNTIEEISTELIESNYLEQTVKISRVDIAVDGCTLHKFIKDERNQNNINNSIGRYRDTDNIIPVYTNIDRYRVNCYDSFTVGRKGSRKENKSSGSKFARYYDKTKEIEDRGNVKEYILDYYRNNEFDLEKRVYRYEVQLKSEFLSKLHAFSWLTIFNKKDLIKLFLTANKGFFEFHHWDKTESKNCTRINMFKDFKTDALYVKIKKKTSDRIRTIKTTIKRQVTDCLTGVYSGEEKLEQQLHTLGSIAYALNAYELRGWFMNHFPHWLNAEVKNAKKLNIEIQDFLYNADIYDNIYELKTYGYAG